MASLDLSQGPVVLVQRRWAFVAGAAFYLAGVAVIGWSFRRALSSNDPWRVGGFVTFVGVFVFGLVTMLLGLWRPGTLSIGPEGLLFRTWARAHFWAWEAITEFRVQSGGESADTIQFFDKQSDQTRKRPKTFSLPGAWPAPLHDVCLTLNEARERWG